MPACRAVCIQCIRSLSHGHPLKRAVNYLPQSLTFSLVLLLLLALSWTILSTVLAGTILFFLRRKALIIAEKPFKKQAILVFCLCRVNATCTFCYAFNHEYYYSNSRSRRHRMIVFNCMTSYHKKFTFDPCKTGLRQIVKASLPIRLMNSCHE